MKVQNEPFRLSVEEVLAQYSTMVYRLAYSRTNNQSDAEDITQEVFMKYMEHRDEMKNPEHLKAWLIRVTVNMSINLVTSAWNRKTTGIDDRQISSYEMEDNSSVREAVMKLPEKYRQIVHLFYFEELSIDEIAKSLEMNVATVKSRLHRARNQLKELLKEEYADV